MDAVFIRDLKVEAIVGIYEFERCAEQLVVVNIEMAGDNKLAAESEDIQKAINYKDVAEQSEALIIEGKFLLVETMAEKLAEMILQNFNTPWVSIEVAKPQAIKNAAAVGVKIERGTKP